MPSAAYSVSLSSGGVAIAQAVLRTNNAPIALQESLVAGISGTLTTRTDNDTGIVTVASHTVLDTETVDLYWATGSRYNCDVTAVTGTTISIDVGSGDNLPSASTAVVICEHVPFNLLIDGDNAKIIGICAESTTATSTSKARVTFKDSGGSTVATVLLTANVPQIWDIEGGATNSFTGNVILTANASNGSSSEALTLKIVGMQDAG